MSDCRQSRPMCDRCAEGFYALCRYANEPIARSIFDQVYSALHELVDLKDLHDWLTRNDTEGSRPSNWNEKNDDYLARKPLAWTAARKVVKP